MLRKAESPQVEEELIKKESLQQCKESLQQPATTEDYWKQKEGKKSAIGGSLPIRKESTKKEWINDEGR